MPNITTTLYISDDVYNKKFLPRKSEILNKMRNEIRKELGLETKKQTWGYKYENRCKSFYGFFEKNPDEWSSRMFIRF